MMLADFAEAKASIWRGKTATNFRTVSRMFNEKFGSLMVADVTPKMLNSWLESFGRPAYAAGLVRSIRPAFSWAVRQGVIPDSPFSKLEPIRVPARQGIDVFTPGEAQRLMQTAPDDCKAAYAMLLFAGIRPVELTRLTWGAVRDGFNHLTPDVTKTAQVRNVEVEPNLAAWLASCGKHKTTDRVCPTNWDRKNRKTRAAAGLVNRQDTARHSYATYHLAKYHNRTALEENMGHSQGSAMLMRHYRAAATPAQAEEYWAILP
jgi:integrase